MPTLQAMVDAAPPKIWDLAIKQAMRSPHKRHRTGCVIFSGKDVYAKGTSHTHHGGYRIRSIHAEMDALSKLHVKEGTDFKLLVALVVTLTKGSHFSYSSKPCTTCAKLLDAMNIGRVRYAERRNDGSWVICDDSPSMLRNMKITKYRDK